MTRKTREAITLLGIVLILAVLVAFVGTMNAHDSVFQSLPACATEDSDNCSWDAQEQGNGMGTSFYVLNGNVHYLPR